MAVLIVTGDKRELNIEVPSMDLSAANPCVEMFFYPHSRADNDITHERSTRFELFSEVDTQAGTSYGSERLRCI